MPGIIKTSVEVQQTGKLRLTCKGNSFHNNCKFVHSGKTCEFNRNAIEKKCNPSEFEKRAHFAWNVYENECVMKISNIQLEGKKR